jgi:hypothetical protein
MDVNITGRMYPRDLLDKSGELDIATGQGLNALGTWIESVVERVGACAHRARVSVTATETRSVRVLNV